MSGFPVFTTPPIDPKTMQWNRQWWLFFQQLWERTGGLSDMTDAEAVGLTRNRGDSASGSGSSAKRQDVELRRQRVSRKSDESVPARHSLPRLLLTKESYKPLTLIRLYTGLTADIPSGWQLADGTNGTPDMRDKFIVGAGNLYSQGSTGGSTTIVANNLPAHTHSYNDKDTTYTANTVAVQSGTGTTVVQSITAGGGDTSRVTGNNTTTAAAFLPPYYAVAYIINTRTVAVVTDAKLR